MKTKKVLITGCLGYVGSVLAPYLQEKGLEVVGYDTGFFKDCVLYKPADPSVTFGDARDFKEKFLKGIDAVVHLAAISNDPFGNLKVETIYDPTREYALAIAGLCKKKGVRFIFSSSCSVYGKGGGELLDEDSPTAPQTPYSANKLQIEKGLSELAGKSFSPIALRFATAFGMSPRIRFDIVANMLTGMGFTEGNIVLNSDGSPWRPNVHVLDMAEAFYRAIKSDYREPRLLVLNVGDATNNLQIISIAKIVQAALTDCKIKFLTENPSLDSSGLITDRKVKGGVDTRTYRVSFDKIKREFPGFSCQWSVTRGVADMVEKFKELGLKKDQFKNKNFYRLQKIESLHQSGLIDDNLRWTAKK